MIAPPSGVRVWLATGVTDMRRGMNGLALQVQQGLQRDPHGGDLYVFRGRRGDLLKILWHDGIGMSLYAKRPERGRFIWPARVGSRRLNLAICSKGSTGETRNQHGGRKRWDSAVSNAVVGQFVVPLGRKV
jgi:transposase